MQYFCTLQSDLMFTWKSKYITIASWLLKEEAMKSIALSDFKTFYKAK